MTTEVDKYIVEFDVIPSTNGTESLVLQQAVGGEGTTYRITLTGIKNFVLSGTGTMKNVDDAPEDGNPYVRLDGEWVLLTDYLDGSP
jgi:hypothetical protein